MRFHHSTRRGRNRLNQRGQYNPLASYRATGSYSSSRWAQLNYCRETNIHFNRRLPVEAPASLASEWDQVVKTLSEYDQPIRSKELSEQVSPISSKSKSSIEEKLKQLSFSDSNEIPVISKTLAGSDKRKSADRGQPSSSSIDMERVRERLVSQVQKHPFWSNKAAKQMQLTSVEERRIYIYELVSFCERRQLEWRFEPYRGGLVSSVPVLRRLQAQLSTGCEIGQQTSSAISLESEHSNEHIRSKTLSKCHSPEPRGSPKESWSISGSKTNSPRRNFLPGSSKSRLERLSQMERSSSAASSVEKTRPEYYSPIRGIQSVSAQHLYEPLGAIQRPLPSPDTIWAVSLPVHLMPSAFNGYSHSSELPNTSFVKRCHGCQGRGRLKCKSCHGVGYEVCLSCLGKGTTRNPSSMVGSAQGSSSLSNACRSDRTATESSESSAFYSPDKGSRRYNSDTKAQSGLRASAWITESCHFCHGAGQKRCWVCAGKSYNHCPGCSGSGQLRCYLNLHIIFLNHRDEIILNNSDSVIPRDRLRLCKGQLLLDQTENHLEPLAEQQLPNPTGELSKLNEADQLKTTSLKMLEKHYQTYRNERLVKQRHRLTLIESHIIGYEWKKVRGSFVTYGDEGKVYIAKYPFKSICNII